MDKVPSVPSQVHAFASMIRGVRAIIRTPRDSLLNETERRRVSFRLVDADKRPGSIRQRKRAIVKSPRACSISLS